MIFGQKTFELPNKATGELTLYWAVLTRVRLSVLMKICGGVFLCLPFLFMILPETRTSNLDKLIFFFIGLVQMPLIYICNKSESFTVSFNKEMGLNLHFVFFQSRWLLKSFRAKDICDIALRCDFDGEQNQMTLHSLIFLFVNREMLTLPIGYSMRQAPSSELMSLTMDTAEIVGLKQMPVLLHEKQIELGQNIETGDVCFKGARFMNQAM